MFSLRKVLWESLMVLFSVMALRRIYLGLWFTRQSSIVLLNIGLSLISSTELTFQLCFERNSLFFCARVSIIAITVIGFSSSYIRTELYNFRFLIILMSFIFSIYLLIFRCNLLFMIIGWDGLGVRSYFLVIYFFSIKSYNAGILTVMTNRLGDVIILIYIGLISYKGSFFFGGVSLDLVYSQFFVVRSWLVVAFFTKSAQVPFSAWLPAAIAAPTPVSSLVHSSTLVTAGVYMYIRILGNFQLNFVLWIGICTIFLAGLRALRERDMKKIVALSTLSQLGIIFVRLGRGLKMVGFYHLLVHAYFKALLFVSVGNIIHLSDDYQDLRKIRSYENNLSLTLTMCVFANLSLVGVPFMRGFLSKDLLLERIIRANRIRMVSFWLFFMRCILTRAYTARFLYSTVMSLKKRQSFVFKFKEDRSFAGTSLFLWALRVSGGALLGWFLFEGTTQLLIPLLFKKFLALIIFFGVILSLSVNSKHYNKYAWRGGGLWSLPFISIRAPSIMITHLSSLIYVVESFIIVNPWKSLSRTESIVGRIKPWKWEIHFNAIIISVFCAMWVYLL